MTSAFDSSLLSAALSKVNVPEGFVLRPLASDDYAKQHIPLLRNLTACPDLTEEEWLSVFNQQQEAKGIYFPIVIEDVEKKILVGTLMLFIERKYIRGAGSAGHIEDVAVDAAYQGKGFGKTLIIAALELGKTLGAYKTLLDCDVKNVGFYEKCGMANKGNYMALYY